MASQAALDLVINLKGADKAETGLERLAKTATSLGKGMTTLAKVGFAGVAAGAAGLVGGFGAAAVSGLRFNSSMENVTAQLNAFTKDGDESARILDMIRDRASKTPFAFGEMASAAAGLIPASRMANESLESIIETAEVLAASNPAEGLEGAAFAIREAVSGDFASAIERFNLPRQMINDLKKEGVPNLEIIRQAMAAMGYDVSLVNNLAETATGRWSTFMDTLQGLAATATGPLFEGLSSGLGTVNQWLTENNASLQTFAAWVGERLGAAFTGAVEMGQGLIGWLQTTAQLWKDSGQGASGLAEQVTIFAGRLAGLSAEQILPFLEKIQSLREGFGLARDAVFTLGEALMGEWKNAENIHPLHQAMGLLGTEIREKVLVASQELTTFWNDTLKPAMSTLGGIIDTEVRRAYTDLTTSWNNDLIPTMQTIKSILDTQLKPAYISSSDTVRSTMATSQTAWDVYLERVRHNVGETKKEWDGLKSAVSTGVSFIAEQLGISRAEYLTTSEAVRDAHTGQKQSWAEWWASVNQNLIDADKRIDEWGNNTLKWLDDTGNAMFEFSADTGRAMQEALAEIEAMPSKAAAAAAKIGVALVTGVAAGIRSAPGVIGGALGKMVGDAIASAQRLIRAHSPAEETAEKIGEPMAQGITKGFVGRMTEDQRKILNSIADTIGKVASAVSSTVKAMTDLSGFKGGTVTGPQLQGLLGGVALIITQIEELAEGFKTEGLEAASKFTEHASKIVGVISSGVTALTALAKWEPTTISGLTVQNLLQGMALVIIQIEEMAEGFRQEGLEAAAQFSDAAGRVVGVIDDAIGGLSALSKWKPAEILGSTVQNLLQGVALVVIQMQEMAEGFEQEGLAAAGLFADAVGKVLAPLKTAIDTFKGLKDFESVAADRMEALAAGIHLAVYWMTEIAKGLDQEATKLAAEISDDIGRIFGALKGGLDFLEGLKDYEGVGPETMQRLLDDMVKMTEHVAAMAKGAFDQAEMSIAWLDDVREFADNYTTAVNTIKNLPAYPEYPSMPNPPSGGGGGGTTNDGTLDSGDQLNFGVSSQAAGGPSYAAAAAPNVNNYTLVQHITTPMHPDTEFGWMQSVWAGVG